MRKHPNKRTRIIISLLLQLCLVLGAGVLVEILYNLPIDKEEDYQYLEESQIETEGFLLQDGVYVSTEGGASLTLTFDEQYVDKLYYEFQYDGQLNAVIYVGDYSREDSSDSRRIEDNNNHLSTSSTVNIRHRTDKITIQMPEEAEHVNIRAVALNNTGNYSLGRFLFVCVTAGILLMLFQMFHSTGFCRPERIFLMISASVGLLMILTLPAHKVGMDEEIHFGRAYYLFDTIAGRDTVTVTPVMNDLITASMNNWPENIPQSEEEQKEEERFWNTNLLWNSSAPSAEFQQNNYRLQLYSFSYLPQAAMIQLGRLFHLDFTVIYRMGRLGNLLLYCAVVYLAIRKIPFGKRVMMALALMPTAMFSAVTYTYDTTVTAFTFLGLAYLMPELMDDGKKLSRRNCLVFILSFVLASLPKPVYIPMLLLALFIPSSRFSSRKVRRLFKGGIIAVFLLMLSTFALEPLLNANQAGDARGGDTSVGRQLRYVFAHPLGYARLLVSSLAEKFFSFTFGYEGLGQMGHLPGNEKMVSAAMLITGVTLTDRREGEKEDLSPVQKWGALCLGFITLCLVWTAMYLSFTPVGADIIRGTQGRYYLPVTILGLLAVRTGAVRNRIPFRIDLTLMTALSAGLLLVSVYGSVICNTF
ncbi:MAG: DUF2142 domain-containing protein [Ruminococcus sp.]|jgi:uncharacterized membrane protein